MARFSVCALRRKGGGEAEERRAGERGRERGGVKRKVGERWRNIENKDQVCLGGSVREASGSWVQLRG